MNKALLYSLGASFVIMVLNIFVYVYLKHGSNAEIYAEYGIYKRTIALVSAGAMLGLPTAIARNSQLYKDKSAHLILKSSGLAVSTLIVIFFATTSVTKLHPYAMPPYVWGYVASIVLCTLLASRMRGELMFLKANLMNVAQAAILSFFIFTCQSLAIAFVLAAIIHSSIYLFFVWRLSRIPSSQVSSSPIPYLKIGLPRLPGDFLFQALLSLPLLLLASTSVSSTFIGDFAFVIAIFSVIIQVAKPIGFVFLPYFSSFLANQKNEMIKQSIARLSIVTIVFAFVLYVMPNLIHTLNHPWLVGYENIIGLLSSLTFAMVGLCFYVMFRAVVDALYNWPINTFTLLISFLVFLISIHIHGNDLSAILSSSNLSLMVLGLTTFIMSAKALR